MTYNHDIHDASQLNRFASASGRKRLRFYKIGLGFRKMTARTSFRSLLLCYTTISELENLMK